MDLLKRTVSIVIFIFCLLWYISYNGVARFIYLTKVVLFTLYVVLWSWSFISKRIAKTNDNIVFFFCKVVLYGKNEKVFPFLLNLFTHSRDRAEKESHNMYFAKMNVRIFYNEFFFCKWLNALWTFLVAQIKIDFDPHRIGN